MSRALKEALESLFDNILQTTARVRTIAEGNGTPGTRAAPARNANNDKRFGVRIDNGERVIKDGVEYKRYKMQANKEAENATIREMADKNPHKVLAVADLPIQEIGKSKGGSEIAEGAEGSSKSTYLGVLVTYLFLIVESRDMS